MRLFYSQIKSADKHIWFVFITGVTKFSRMGIFSPLNNLVDISIRPKFGAFMGYTQKELNRNFAPYLRRTARRLGMGKTELSAKIRDYYDGFSFDGLKRLYNPFSILYFLTTKNFDNFWMMSGSNTLIRRFLSDKRITADQYQGKEVDRSFVMEPGEIDITPPEGFLYQAGYLTLRYKDPTRYVLELPNLEVRASLSALFLESRTPSSAWTDVVLAGRDLQRHLEAADVPGMVGVFSRLLSGIFYGDHADANRGFPDAVSRMGSCSRTSVRRSLRRPRRKPGKSPNRWDGSSPRRKARASTAPCCTPPYGWPRRKVTPEKGEGLGRLDLEAVYGDRTYVIELKMSTDAQGAGAAARDGLRQIRATGDGLASENPILVSLAISKEDRNIAACLYEIDGREAEVEIRLPERRPAATGDNRE
jgi:hypothetical protein